MLWLLLWGASALSDPGVRMDLRSCGQAQQSFSVYRSEQTLGDLGLQLSGPGSLAVGSLALALGSEASAVGVMHFGSEAFALGSWPIVLGSWALALGSWALAFGTWACAPASRILGSSSRVLSFSSGVLAWSSSDVFSFSFDLRRRFRLSAGISVHRNFGTSLRRNV